MHDLDELRIHLIYVAGRQKLSAQVENSNLTTYMYVLYRTS